jgi:hypothetical protein
MPVRYDSRLERVTLEIPKPYCLFQSWKHNTCDSASETNCKCSLYARSKPTFFLSMFIRLVLLIPFDATTAPCIACVLHHFHLFVIVLPFLPTLGREGALFLRRRIPKEEAVVVAIDRTIKTTVAPYKSLVSDGPAPPPIKLEQARSNVRIFCGRWCLVRIRQQQQQVH